jgi:Rad3-related DNA helicase
MPEQYESVALFFHSKSNNMQLQTATRVHTKIKLALQGPSGSGKTYSALLVAYGLCGEWTKIAVIDTENQSALQWS